MLNCHMGNIHPSIQESKNPDEFLFFGYFVNQNVTADNGMTNRIIINQII